MAVGLFGGLVDFISTLKNNNRLKVEVDFVTGASVSKVSVDSADTTSDYLNGKLAVGSSKLAKTITGVGSAETLVLDVNQANLTLTSSQISDFTEASQDAIGGALLDTASVDLTYNDGANQISAAVLPAGVDHNSLANLTVADPHTQYVNREANGTVTDNAITRWDTTTGRDIQTSLASVDDNGAIITPAFIRLGNTADTTNGNIYYATTNTEFLARANGVTQVLATTPTVLSSVTPVSTTSATYATITTMTETPVAGTYLVIFSASVAVGTNTTGDVAIFLAGTEQTAYTRHLAIQAGGLLGAVASYEVPVFILAVLAVNGSQVLDMRFRENGSDTVTCNQRQLTIIPISR